MLADRERGFAQTHDQCFITQGQQTGRLQADDGDAFFGKRQQRIHHFLGANFGLAHHAAGQKCPAAAKWFATCSVFSSNMRCITGRDEHF